MRNPFPIYDRLVLEGHPPETLAPAGSKFFDLSGIVDSYDASPTVNKGTRILAERYAEFGPLVSPYPNLWAEYTLKDTPLANYVTQMDNPEDRAALGRDVPPGGHAFAVATYGEVGRGIVKLPVIQVFATDHEGRFVWSALAETRGGQGTDGFTLELTPVYTGVAAFALGLINCKNVTTPELESGGKASRKSRRIRKGVRYHVIQLPGQSRSSAAGQGSGGPVALHTVRGHFKTYTADRPLMGRLTGTYWWADHARGSKDQGEIISSYKVGTP